MAMPAHQRNEAFPIKIRQIEQIDHRRRNALGCQMPGNRQSGMHHKARGDQAQTLALPPDDKSSRGILV